MFQTRSELLAPMHAWYDTEEITKKKRPRNRRKEMYTHGKGKKRGTWFVLNQKEKKRKGQSNGRFQLVDFVFIIII